MASRNKLAFWVNDRKNAANQPDYKGKFELSWELLQEANAAFGAGQYELDYNGQPCIKLDVALYAQQLNPGDKKPIMSGSVSTLAETQQSAALRQQAAQGYAQQQAPQGYAQPAQPQYPQAQPQYAQAVPVQQGTQLGPWGQPGPEVAAGIMAAHAIYERSQQPQAAPQGYSQAPQAQPQQPQPAYPQQPPQGYAQPPAQPQAPMPVAPPAPVQPMPGAIHGQQPAPVLPQNF